MKKHKRVFVALFVAWSLIFSSAQAEITLKLNGVVERYIGDFSVLHPNVVLNGENYKYYATMEELANDLLLGTFDYDVFELSNSRMDYRALMVKRLLS